MLAAGSLAVFGIAMPAAVPAATGPEAMPVSAASDAVSMGDGADFWLRFVQEDGPSSGHVRVELTPETRPLTLMEARMAAEKGFLAALDKPGLGDNLSRIKVVVRLMPANHPDPDQASQVIIYQHKDGPDWAVFAGE
jgi:hypothetical protein